eukprot:TRINITY_DN2796_c0_g1_i2.p1 TRINITY_DN2796_c0_g1~~TRINITY_DN2796_c0_g1_i2.p1  ORF type:complete len:112 (+),score=21.59 TRINITY_DN2796_c0_g1_i2:259-594(+)
MSALRTRVLKSYADLLRAQRRVLNTDSVNRQLALNKTREEYRKFQNLENAADIEDKLEYSQAVVTYLNTNLIQATKMDENKYELKIGSNVEPKKMYEPITKKEPRKRKEIS